MDCEDPGSIPLTVVDDFAALLKSYRVSRVTGDRYAGEFPRELFRKHGIAYDLAKQTKSELFRDLLPLLNSGRIVLPRNVRLQAQIVGLERREVLLRRKLLHASAPAFISDPLTARRSRLKFGRRRSLFGAVERSFAREDRTGDQHDVFSIATWFSRTDLDGRLEECANHLKNSDYRT